MQRSRLKNIINKSKEISNKSVGDPFDDFKKSLPKEVDDSYRLKEAWKAYGSPKDFKEAIWYGMICPVGENDYKFPSIGYNEETDEYEYLNSGKENDLVAKDIRVWDNDVIPLVKELKLGGYVRLFNEEKNCWTYSKNSQKREQLVEDKGEQIIDSFQKGGKPKLDSKESGEEPVGYLNDGTPLYRKGDGTIGPLTKENIGKDNLFDLIKNSNANWAKRLQDPNRKYITYPDGSYDNFKLAWSEDETGTIVYPEIQEIDGQLVDLSEDREKAWKSAIEHKDYIYFPSNDAADWFTKNYKNYYKGFDKTPQAFKQGGKTKSYQEWIKTVPQDRLSDNYDLETAYKYLPIEELEKWRTATPEQLKDESYHLRSVAPYGNGDYIFLKKGREWINPEVNGELQQYHLGKTGLQFSHDLIFDENQNRYFYKQKKGFNPQAFKQGGQMSVIPEGALHARKNNMELAKEGGVTSKGVPVVDNNGEQQAEIERNEIIFRKEITDKMEELYKKYNSSESSSEKDEIAIKMGKILTCEITKNTDDKTGLIQEVEQNM